MRFDIYRRLQLDIVREAGATLTPKGRAWLATRQARPFATER